MSNAQFQKVANQITNRVGHAKSEREKNNLRMRAKRATAARITIPDIENPQRRERCLADPELFLRTYFADRYKKEFDHDRLHIIETMWDLAQTKGRHAMAAPRGRGKTEIVKGMTVAVILAGFVRFAFAGGQTTGHGWNIYDDIKTKFAQSEVLGADFPEVCFPVRDLEGAPLRSHKQNIDGQLTNIVWKATGYCSLPFVPEHVRLAKGFADYGGVKFSYFGLDAAFRGKNIQGDRPDFIVVDDPETEESARSYEQIEKRKKILNQDIAGLVQEGSEIALSVFTTVQNRVCLSYQLTDPSQMPQFGGKRFGMIEKWPITVEDATDEAQLGLWSEYIALRKKDQMEGDKHGLTAVRFYLENRDAMDDGAAMLSDAFDAKLLPDGTQVTHSALQVAFNKIADTNLAAYRTEYQNDPEKVEEVERLSLTAARVQSRSSRLEQGEVPPETQFVTVGIDLGKYASHWTAIAWESDRCVGSIVDYGIMETHGLNKDSDNKAIEAALSESLEIWADEVCFRYTPPLVLIDSGNWRDGAYNFCRKFGKPYYPAKGWDQGRFRLPKRSKENVPFLEAYARRQVEERIWLYNVQTEYWKQWLQERFLTKAFDATGHRTDGSLAVFNDGGDPKRHLSFAHHLTAEEERWIPIEGKQLKREWYVKSRNNHWLDSTALACAAGGCLGIRLVRSDAPTAGQVVKRKPKPRQRMRNQYGQSFVATGR